MIYQRANNLYNDIKGNASNKLTGKKKPLVAWAEKETSDEFPHLCSMVNYRAC